MFGRIREKLRNKPTSLQSTLNSFAPYDSGLALVRLGGNKDGSYVIPDCLDDVDGIVSLGCGQNILFEEEFFSRTGLKAVIVDSQDNFPLNFTSAPHTFIHGWIGDFVHPIDKQIPIFDLIQVLSITGNSGLKNGVLKIDIESSEYSLLLRTDSEILRKFKIIIIEFHRLNEIKISSNFRRFVDEIMRKLANDFVICYFHPNNAVDYFKVNNTYFPSCIEVTFLRKEIMPLNRMMYSEQLRELEGVNDATRKTIPITFPIRL